MPNTQEFFIEVLNVFLSDSFYGSEKRLKDVCRRAKLSGVVFSDQFQTTRSGRDEPN